MEAVDWAIHEAQEAAQEVQEVQDEAREAQEEEDGDKRDLEVADHGDAVVVGDQKDPVAVARLLPEIKIDMRYGEDGLQRMFLQGEDVTTSIRLPEISMYASDVSAIPAVRAFLLDMQRDMAKRYNVIMDGRDIGTVVLPDADVKIFLTAPAEVRAQRRMKELAERGTPCAFEEVLRDIEQRDWNDSHRETAPLRQADDAVLVDNGDIDFEESKQQLLRVIKEALGR